MKLRLIAETRDIPNNEIRSRLCQQTQLLRRQQPHHIAAKRGHGFAYVDATDTAFFQLNRESAAVSLDYSRNQAAEVRLMTYQYDSLGAGMTFDLSKQVFGRSPRRKVSALFDVFLAQAHRGGDNFRGLGCARERTGQYQVKLDPEFDQALSNLAHTIAT